MILKLLQTLDQKEEGIKKIIRLIFVLSPSHESIQSTPLSFSRKSVFRFQSPSHLCPIPLACESSKFTCICSVLLLRLFNWRVPPSNLGPYKCCFGGAQKSLWRECEPNSTSVVFMLFLSIYLKFSYILVLYVY